MARYYLGNKIFENNQLKRILLPNGYIANNNYYFYARDHLGNNSLVQNAAGTVLQRTYYYPYGKPVNSESSGGNLQPYKYGGKEDEPMFGLGMYDFNARQLNYKGIPVFLTMDPLAEKYYSWSPYAYCAGNPVKFVDPTGMAWRPVDMGGNIVDDDDVELIHGYRWVDERDLFSGQVKSKFLSSIGLNSKEVESEDAEVREEASEKLQQTTEAINDFAGLLTSSVPFGSAILTVAKVLSGQGQNVTAEDVGWTAAEIIPATKIVKGAKVAVKSAEALQKGGKVAEKGTIFKGGKYTQKMGKAKGNMSGNRAVQQKQFDAVINQLNLNQTQAKQLHKAIHGEGLGYHEMLQVAKDMFR